jgi:hypothetical protein
MSTPQERLAQSLTVLKKLQDKGVVAIHTKHMPRTHRERLVNNGFIKEVIKGWYVSARPDEPAGESTAWYTSFWAFCADYLESRFGDQWCLSPEHSLSVHSGGMCRDGCLFAPLKVATNQHSYFMKPLYWMFG